ncbi:hypothetical protein L218DRAFT_1005263 [Marasmius fiardii PR-910]|nr:hypothetical protein L218DRAFT_1005263 [Marasmius fiardii PR-910]
MSATSPNEIQNVEYPAKVKTKQRQKRMTLEELNKTLVFDYMFENGPYEELPVQYYPIKKYDHYPPIFDSGHPVSHVSSDWGIALTSKELEEYGRKNGLVTAKPNVHLSSPECGLLISRTAERFNERHGLGSRTRVDITLPATKEGVVLVKVLTNYGTSLSRDALLDLCENVESSFGKRGKWYISNANKSFCDDYYIYCSYANSDFNIAVAFARWVQ